MSLLLIFFVTGSDFFSACFRVNRFFQSDRLVVLDEKKQQGDDQTGERDDPEGMTPSPMGGDKPADDDAGGHSDGDGGIPDSHHEGPLFFGIEGGNHRRSAGGITGFSDADRGAGRKELAEILCQGAGGRGQAPQYGHDADALFPTPAVDHDGNGEGEEDNGPVDGGNHRPALGIGQAPVRFQEGKE